MKVKVAEIFQGAPVPCPPYTGAAPKKPSHSTKKGPGKVERFLAERASRATGTYAFIQQERQKTKLLRCLQDRLRAWIFVDEACFELNPYLNSTKGDRGCCGRCQGCRHQCTPHAALPGLVFFSATRCFLGATLVGGGEAPQDRGPGGWEPPERFQQLSLSFGGQKSQNSGSWGHGVMGVISTNDTVSALVSQYTFKT